MIHSEIITYIPWQFSSDLTCITNNYMDSTLAWRNLSSVVRN